MKALIKNEPYGKTLLYALILLAVLLPLWWWASLHYEEKLLSEKQNQISGIAATTANALSEAVNRRVALQKSLKAFVDARLDAAQAISPTEFSIFAGGLLAGSSGIRNLAIAAEGALPLVYPESERGNAFTLDPVRGRQSQVSADLQRAMRSRLPVLSGPYGPKQKGQGLQSAQAVYRGDTLWGIVSMTISLAPIFAESGLDRFPAGLAVALQDPSGRPFYGSKALPDTQVFAKIDLPEGYWKLTAMPAEGWDAAVSAPLFQFRAITLAIVLLVTALVCLLTSYRRRLKAAVRERTGELQRSLTDRRDGELQLNRTLGNLRQAMGATLDTMAVAIEAKDPCTAGHHRRTADLARVIATEMGLAEEATGGLRMAAAFHDIGKICLSAEILVKPSKLEDMELTLVRTHVQKGYDILKEIDFPWSVARVVWQHHERMNGSGYPLGLSGDEILPEARILAVADVVVAMVSPRAYRPLLGLEKALEEIEEQRGTLYDPIVVDACLRIFREKDFRLE